MISTNNRVTHNGYGFSINFNGKADTFWRAYNKEFNGIPLKDTIIKSISNEQNLLGEGLSKKGYNLIGLKNYVIRIYKNNFKFEDLNKDFINAKKNHLNSLEGVVLNIPGKIDIVKKRQGESLGVNKYAERINIEEFPPLRNITVSREESIKSLETYEQVKDFPIKSFIQAYNRMGDFCKKKGFQFDIISPNNILIDTKSKKINLIDPVGPNRNNDVHGKFLDFTKFHGADSLYPVLCDFIMQKEHIQNLTPDEISRWKHSLNIIIAKCIIAGKLAGFEQNSDKLRILYERIDKYWTSKNLCERYDEFNNTYSKTIEQAHIIADAINHKNSEKSRIEAINKFNDQNFEKLRPVFEKIIEAPHQPKVEFPEILNATLDKLIKYGDKTKNIIPTIEKLFNKEIFYTTKKRLYHLFTLIQPSNKRFLEEVDKSAKNTFEKNLYKNEIEDLYKTLNKLPLDKQEYIKQIYKTAMEGEKLPQYLIDKLWISRTCTNTGEAQEISLNNMIKAYKHIESQKGRIPKAEDLIELHKIIMANTPGQEHIIGRLRTPDTDILIGQIFNIKKKIKKPVCDYSASKDVIRDLEKLNSYIETNYDKMDTFDLASNIFSEVIRIHPFLNGNGRATRLFTEQFLLSKGFRLLKWPEETLYRKVCSTKEMAEALRTCSEKIK